MIQVQRTFLLPRQDLALFRWVHKFLQVQGSQGQGSEVLPTEGPVYVRSRLVTIEP